MKRKIALILTTLMMIASVHSFAAVTGGREYAFADDNAQVTTSISAIGDVATVSVYISGGIYGFTGISVGYKYNPQMLTLLKTDGTPAEENAVADDVLQRSIKKANLNYGWMESFSHKNGQIRYFITSNGEFASYRSGETEKVVELKFKINTAGGEDSISYLPEATTITCGDTSIYYNPARTTEKMLDGSSIFKIGKNLKAYYIEITDETYTKINTVYMAVGNTKSLKIKSQIPSEILWGASGTEAATVDDNGVISALATGKTTIMATDAFGNTDEIEIIVQESKLLPEEIKIICPDTLMAGDMIRPTYEMSPKNVTATSVIWSLEGENALLLTDDPVLWVLSEGRVLLRASLAADVNIYTEKYVDIL
ncbi:MAG: Ig-like domain-containing protein, partial [Clostridia bacterium]|nr:Ig-like domain-containing protein [Clostridia bacterium]